MMGSTVSTLKKGSSDKSTRTFVLGMYTPSSVVDGRPTNGCGCKFVLGDGAVVLALKIDY